ncbi:hypothetical protein [Seohaeicola zhoushanensis]|uniref:hypothetical protein n=1 Tax=Seohaeicola zhoushanensis TaxID=1569283 RepID=UPI001679822B|nr:hypothetical protein [Seohaeicola zhoushanensis]
MKKPALVVISLFAFAAWPAAGIAQTSAACDPHDQLVCACTNLGFKPSDPRQNACFLGDVNYATITQVDPLSQRAFIALNWPVKRDGEGKAVTGLPDFDASLSGDWTTVWETWKSTNAIFRNGNPPLDWDVPGVPLPGACSEIDTAAARAAIPYSSQIPDAVPPRFLDEYVNPDGHALLDRNGVPVRFDVHFNRQAYDYVAGNRLWDARDLERFIEANKRLDLPVGTWDKGDGVPAKRGAIVIKSAWKVLDAKDDPARFHKSWAYITPVIENGKLTHECQLKPVGLVGLHIAYKTATMKDWAWSTFEHTEIAPLWSEIGATEEGAFGDGSAVPDWLFYGKEKPSVDQRGAAKLNTPPKKALDNQPSRITRFYPNGYYAGPVSAGDTETCSITTPEFHCLNVQLAGHFAGSPLGNYRLKGTQWLKYSPGMGGYTVLPEILGNAVIETFTQDTSNCMSCHSFAGPEVNGSPKGMYDFLFSFGRDVLNPTVPLQAR